MSIDSMHNGTVTIFVMFAKGFINNENIPIYSFNTSSLSWLSEFWLDLIKYLYSELTIKLVSFLLVQLVVCR